MTEHAFRPIPAMRLAIEFAKELRQRLNARKFGLVIERNRHERDPRICHSHDFCDANMVMDAAWRALGITADGMDPASDEQAELWNSAWDLAKRTDFDRALTLRYWTEFPPEFHPDPTEVAALEVAGATDTSWHNDACPSWSWHVPGQDGDATVTIFVDAPEPEHREADGLPRFQVTHGPEFDGEAHAPLAWLYEGDDLQTAIRIARDAHENVLAGVRRRAAAES